MNANRTPQVLFYPHANSVLKQGFDEMATLLALTLGPSGRNIVTQHEISGKPEVQSDAATIARRIIAVPNRANDVGAMLMRNLVWRTAQRVGDGSAMAAVLAQSILHQATRYRTAGANVMMLKRGIEHALQRAINLLGEMALPVRNHRELTGLILGMTAETQLSALLGEMFYNLGPDAHIDLEMFVAPYLERVYLEGGRWVGRIASPYLYTDASARVGLQTDCAVALFAGDVTSADEVLPLLELIADLPEAARKVALIAHEVSGSALATFTANHQAKNMQILAIELRRAGAQRSADFEDIAVMTGAQVLMQERGQLLRSVRQTHMGMARRVEATPNYVLLSNPAGEAGGSRQSIARQVAMLEARMKIAAQSAETETMIELQQRMARLVGRVATLKIGAYSETERNLLKSKAEKAIRATPLAINDGVVAGGGAALVVVANHLLDESKQPSSETPEMNWGTNIVAHALYAPFHQIARNAGVVEPDVYANEIIRAYDRKHIMAFDAVEQKVVSARKSGLLDPVGVLREVLNIAGSGALMALTIDALVLHSDPKLALEP